MAKARIDVSRLPGNGARAAVDEALVAKTLPSVVDRCALGHAEEAHVAQQDGIAARWLKRVPEFVEALFETDEDRAAIMAAAALSEAGDPQRVVELLFRPAACAIGEGWQADEADFLQVTIATGRMQCMFRHMSREHPPVVAPDAARRLLLAPAPGDQHAFGLSVVEDAFRRVGWDVDRCECGEVPEMYRLVSENAYLVIGISVSVGRVLPELSSLAKVLRAKSRNPSVILMAGGGIVADRAQDALDAGFDLTASDALHAVALAQSAIGQGAGSGAGGVHPSSMAAE